MESQVLDAYFKAQAEQSLKTDKTLSEILKEVKTTNERVIELEIEKKSCPKPKVEELAEKVHELGFVQRNCPIKTIEKETEGWRVLGKNIKTVKWIVGLISISQIAQFILIIKDLI